MVLVYDRVEPFVIVASIFGECFRRFDLYVFSEQEVAVSFSDAGSERVDNVLTRRVTNEESLAANVPVREATNSDLVLLVESAATLNLAERLTLAL